MLTLKGRVPVEGLQAPGGTNLGYWRCRWDTAELTSSHGFGQATAPPGLCSSGLRELTTTSPALSTGRCAGARVA